MTSRSKQSLGSHWQSTLCVILGVFLASEFAPARGQIEDAHLQSLVSVECLRGCLADVLEQLSDQTGVKLTADQPMGDIALTVIIQEQPLGEVLGQLVQFVGAEFLSQGQAPDWSYHLQKGLRYERESLTAWQQEEEYLAQADYVQLKRISDLVIAALEDEAALEKLKDVAPQCAVGILNEETSAQYQLWASLSPAQREMVLRGGPLVIPFDQLSPDQRGLVFRYPYDGAGDPSDPPTYVIFERRHLPPLACTAVTIHFPHTDKVSLGGGGDFLVTHPPAEMVDHLDRPALGLPPGGRFYDPDGQGIPPHFGPKAEMRVSLAWEPVGPSPDPEENRRLWIREYYNPGHFDLSHNHDLADALRQLTAVAGINVIADYYALKPEESLPEIDNQPLGLVLKFLAHRYQRTCVWEEPFYLWRSRTWAHDRAQEVPVRLIRAWRERLEDQGRLAFEDYVEIVTALSDAQLVNLRKVAPDLPFGQVDGPGPSQSDWAALRFYGALSPGERNLALRREGLAYSQMNPATQIAFRSLYLDAPFPFRAEMALDMEQLRKAVRYRVWNEGDWWYTGADWGAEFARQREAVIAKYVAETGDERWKDYPSWPPQFATPPAGIRLATPDEVEALRPQ